MTSTPSPAPWLITRRSIPNPSSPGWSTTSILHLQIGCRRIASRIERRPTEVLVRVVSAPTALEDYAVLHITRSAVRAGIGRDTLDWVWRRELAAGGREYVGSSRDC